MTYRGARQTFYVALPVAFLSGLGVAVSLLDEQTSSLVGVAISASLLPPAVNAGILWVCHAFVVHSGVIPPPAELLSAGEIDPHRVLATDDESFDASCDDRDGCDYELEQYYTMGMISLLVTLANIGLIWLSSMLYVLFVVDCVAGLPCFFHPPQLPFSI